MFGTLGIVQNSEEESFPSLSEMWKTAINISTRVLRISDGKTLNHKDIISALKHLILMLDSILKCTNL